MVERYRPKLDTTRGVLDNPKHERFAQLRAEGKTQDEAFVLAGYKPNRGNATALNANHRVAQRIQQLLEGGAERAEVTVARIVREWARIAFADVRNIMSWRSNVTVVGNDPDTDEPALRSFAEMVIKDSNEISEDVSAAISEVIANKDGTLRVKLHDKMGALLALAKHFGALREIVEHQGKGGGPIQTTLQIPPEVLDKLEPQELMVLEKVFGRISSPAKLLQIADKSTGANEYEKTLH